MMETLAILLFNWRDIGHPQAGGAEVFVHEVAKRWAREGHSVGLFTSRYRGSEKAGELEGVKVYRAGGPVTVYRQAARHWRAGLSGQYDILIDVINTRPFMTPKFVDSGSRLICLIFQLAREYWFRETPFPINLLGYYWLEKHWLSRYTKIPCVTISQSTEQDLIELGFEDVERLTRAKRPEMALRAFRIIQERIPGARLWIVGDGYLRHNLERMATHGVTFFGRASDNEKFRLLHEAHAILVPGTREGWGLVVLEANAMATPASAFNIPGLRDSVVHGQTGILLESNDAQTMADWCVRLTDDPALLKRLSEGALAWSRRFSWDETSERFSSVLQTH